MVSALKYAVAFAALTLSIAPSQSAPARRGAYDGSWNLTFTTRAGGCDPSYVFDVNIANGVISHPNLRKFRGNVAQGGAVRASVSVSDKFASGSGRLSRTNGRGSWSGYSGSSRCQGTWTAQRI